MKRWTQDYFVTLRQWKLHHEMHVAEKKNYVREPGKAPYEIDCQCDEQKGRFRKRDAHDCGRPRCMLCHCDKVPKRKPTLFEKKVALSFREQLTEIRAI
jgi:hypothetical protein